MWYLFKVWRVRNIYFDLQDADGRTALHVAAWQGYTDIVQARNIKYSALVLIQILNVGFDGIYRQ
jgi:hypothetical protein